MNYYRLYFRKGPSGPIVKAEEISARDDAEACEIAQNHVGKLAIELWCGNRMVRCLDPDEAWAGERAAE